jgi:tripartite-type tricarboxylate transporter receptor subunit TctC
MQVILNGLGSSATHTKSGRIKALMVSGSQRTPDFSDVLCAAGWA